MKIWEVLFVSIALIILGIIFLNKFIGFENIYEIFNDKDAKLLCIPNNEKRDYNMDTNKYEKKHFVPFEEDLIISIEENKLSIHRDNGTEDFPRVKLNTDPSTFLMGFYKKSFNFDNLGVGFTFLRKSGRLLFYKEGGQYGIDKNIRIETYYVCSKFKKNLF